MGYFLRDSNGRLLMSGGKLINITGELTPPETTKVKLATPIVTVSTAGTASWPAVANASGYKYKIGNDAERSTSSRNVLLSDGQDIIVKAVGDGESYLDSDWSAKVSYTDPDIFHFAEAYRLNNLSDIMQYGAPGLSYYYANAEDWDSLNADLKVKMRIWDTATSKVSAYFCKDLHSSYEFQNSNAAFSYLAYFGVDWQGWPILLRAKQINYYDRNEIVDALRTYLVSELALIEDDLNIDLVNHNETLFCQMSDGEMSDEFWYITYIINSTTGKYDVTVNCGSASDLIVDFEVLQLTTTNYYTYGKSLVNKSSHDFLSALDSLTTKVSYQNPATDAMEYDYEASIYGEYRETENFPIPIEQIYALYGPVFAKRNYEYLEYFVDTANPAYQFGFDSFLQDDVSFAFLNLHSIISTPWFKSDSGPNPRGAFEDGYVSGSLYITDQLSTLDKNCFMFSNAGTGGGCPTIMLGLNYCWAPALANTTEEIKGELLSVARLTYNLFENNASLRPGANINWQATDLINSTLVTSGKGFDYDFSDSTTGIVLKDDLGDITGYLGDVPMYYIKQPETQEALKPIYVNVFWVDNTTGFSYLQNAVDTASDAEWADALSISDWFNYAQCRNVLPYSYDIIDHIKSSIVRSNELDFASAFYFEINPDAGAFKIMTGAFTIPIAKIRRLSNGGIQNVSIIQYDNSVGGGAIYAFKIDSTNNIIGEPVDISKDTMQVDFTSENLIKDILIIIPANDLSRYAESSNENQAATTVQLSFN